MSETGRKAIPDIRITRFSEGDAEALAALIHESWGKGPDAAYYRWQYLHNPLSEQPYAYLAWDGDKLVGAIGGLIFTIEWQGMVHQGAQITDAVVRSSHRRYGVAKLLYDHFKQAFAKAGTVKCIMCVGNRLAKNFMNKNEDSIQQIAVPPLRIRPIRSRPILAKKGLGWAAPVVDLKLSLWNQMQILCSHGSVLEDVTDADWASGHDDKWNDPGKPLHLLKSPEWLRWRYASGTKERFSVLRMRWKERPLLAIVKHATENNVLYIADMVNVGADTAAARALLARLIRYGAQVGADSLQLMKLPGTPLQPALTKLLFIYRPEEDGMIMIGGYPNDPVVREWQDAMLWDFNMGDCDRL